MHEVNSRGEIKMRRKYVGIKPSLQYLSQITSVSFKISSLKLIMVKKCVPNLDLNAHSSKLQQKSHLSVPFLGIARPQSQFPRSSIFGCRKIDRPILEIYKSLRDIQV
jgi:hypothetical protein